MDELIYLSRGKLQQFLVDPGQLRLRDANIEITLPFGRAGLTLSGGGPERDADYHRLRAIKESLDASNRAPLWFEDPKVGPGDWIEFDVAMTHAVIDSGAGRQLFFAQTSDGQPTTRLLLYGSELNLVGAAAVPQSPVDALDSSAASLRTVVRRLAGSADSDLIGTSDAGLRTGISVVLNRLQDPLSDRGQLQGWARVITAVPNLTPGMRVLLATPLYVRYST